MMPELTEDDLIAIFRGDECNAHARNYPMYPLLSPGMPPVGLNFTAHAQALGDKQAVITEGKGKNKKAVDVGFNLQYLYLRALYDNQFYLPLQLKGRVESVQCLPGHLWGGEAEGPRFVPDELLEGRPRVMVVGKMPSYDEVQQSRNLSGPAGDYLKEVLTSCGMAETDLNDWYVCNLVRWANPNAQSGALPAVWIKDCLPLLHQEFRLCLPDYVLCLGAEATKAVCGTKCTLANMIGRHIELEIPVHEAHEEPRTHKMQVMAATSPSNVLRATELHPQFEATIRNFVRLIKKQSFTVAEEESVKWMAVYKERDLKEIVDHVLSHPGLKKIAVDGEWHGHHPGEPGSYLRTVQISYNGKFAVVIVLREAGGEVAFAPSIDAASRQLQRLLDRDDVQIGGSFLAADLPWLEYAGINLRHRISVPAELDQFRGGNYAGAFDVALAHHACNETADFKLEVMSSRLCGAPRWDVKINEWKKDHCSKLKIKAEDLGGYGEVPDEILLPYSAYDAAFTRQLMDIHCKLLNADRFGNDCWRPFHVSMMAFPAFVEMGLEGVKVDRQRVDELTDTFIEAASAKITELQQAIRWPGFNPRSSQQCIEFLFGERFSTKIDATTGAKKRIRPMGALSLNLQPVKSTSGRAWGWVVSRGEQHMHAPCTDKEVCGILGAQHPLASQLRDVRIIDQVLKSIFRPPETVNKKSNVYAQDADGHRIYKGGIGKYVCHDDRVRSTFVQVKETGRSSSARPNLQAISKRRESDYLRVLGEQYKWPIRSILTSNTDPEYGEPTVLLEADYRGAELLVMAVMARDKQMLDHCLRASLPEDDPNYYDIHANTAIRAFQLDCAPTKSGLKSIGKSAIRIASKTVLFSIEYGAVAETCARRCQEEGVPVNTEEAQKIINTIFATYPGIPDLQDKLRARANNPGWLCNPFGRLRRCIPSSDKSAMSAMEREFLNSLMQSTVADSVSTALYYLYNHPRREELGYRIVLQIHDAVILEVPTRSLDEVYNKIMPECMVDRVTFKACDLDGVPYPDSPDYRFDIDKEVVTRWGIPITKEECDELAISHAYAH